MAMALFLYYKRQERQKETQCSFLSKEETEKVDEAVAKMLEVSKQLSALGKSRGKYNCYSDKQRAQIGKYAAENGPTSAAKHFATLWKMDINELTAQRLKEKYLEKLNETVKRLDLDLEKDGI